MDAAAKEALILELHAASLIYLDLRVLVSHPRLLAVVAALLGSLASATAVRPYDLLYGRGGGPYTALPFVSVLSVAFRAGDTVLIVEDLVTSGASVLETVALAPLRAEGLLAADAIVVVDREQGGRENLAANGVTLHSLMTLTEVLALLVRHGKVTEQKAAEVKRFLDANRTVAVPPDVPVKPRVARTLFTERWAHAQGQ